VDKQLLGLTRPLPRDAEQFLTRARAWTSQEELLQGTLEYITKRFNVLGATSVAWCKAGVMASHQVGLNPRVLNDWISRWPAQDRVMRAALEHHLPVHDRLLYTDQEWHESGLFYAFLQPLGAYHYLCVPLHGGAGCIAGMIGMFRADAERAFEVEDLTWVSTISGHLSATLARIEEVSVAPASALAHRELEVARLAAAGRDNAAIASQLGIARETVKKALGRVYDKLHVTGRAEMAAHLVRSGLL
jgi:DNA-binding CsgD family transcriptional regulator